MAAKYVPFVRKQLEDELSKFEQQSTKEFVAKFTDQTF
jgi:hypothetical protein